MKNIVAPALAVIAAAFLLFFAGRWTAPKAPDHELHRKYDSLEKEKNNALERAYLAEEREEAWKEKADEFYRDGLAAQQLKPLNQKTYEEDTARNHRARPDQRDSVLLARYALRLRATPR